MAEHEIVPAVYRYFTVDLLTNETLEEIPFSGVSYGRAIKSAGSFQGTIPVIDETDNLNLYENTTPGNTALYVVRDGVCVWGGIIWDRSYTATGQSLQVSASEFTSYFAHRLIWKTWNQEFGATVTIASGAGTVVFDYGSSTPVSANSTVELSFFDEEDFQYNGFYRVASTPAPTTSGFSIVGGQAVADIASIQVSGNVAMITTQNVHGFQDGDVITVDTAYGAPFDGTFTINAPLGSNSTYFTYPVSSADIALQVASGVASRPTPDGVYQEVTVSVRTDTYDFARNLIDSVMSDFVGTNFPNAYLSPGISYSLNITNKALSGGLATLTTSSDHGLTVGQAVVIQDVGPQFDGEFEVLQTPATNVLVYAASGTLSSTPVTATTAAITGISMANGLATVTTLAAHGMAAGNNISVFIGYDYPDFNGTWVVETVLSPTSFTYQVLSSNTLQTKTLVNATAGGQSVIQANVTSNVAKLTLATTPTMHVSDSISVANVNLVSFLTEKSLNQPVSIASYKTDGAHYLTTGQSVTIDGLSDTSLVTSLAATTTATTLTTQQRHNFQVGQVVTVDSMQDIFIPTAKALTSNVASLTVSNANVSVGASITVANLVDNYAITTKALTSNVATLTTSTTHNVKVNDVITVSALHDVASVNALEVSNGIAIITTTTPHNFLENQAIVVSGLGAPYDFSGNILSVTETRVFYDITDNAAAFLGLNTSDPNVDLTAAQHFTIAPRAVSGTITSTDSYFNGNFTVSAVTSNTVSFALVGNDIVSVADTGNLAESSILNGVFTVTVNNGTTISYAVTGNNLASEAVPVAASSVDLQGNFAQNSIFNGAQTITAITGNTLTFAKALTYAIASVGVLGNVSAASIFNGTRTITATPSTTSFQQSLTAASNVLEDDTTNNATVTQTSLFNGTQTVTAVDTVNNTVSYALTYQNIPNIPIQGYGAVTVQPTAIVSTFGAYPGNADLELSYSTRGNSGTNLAPVSYRGFNLTNVGDALDKYSDSIDGFDYRIDCDFDESTETFSKTFILIPLSFPNPPGPGEVSPLSRYGAQNTVFEYPGGNIIDISLDESAENSATRFFMVGATDSGPDTGPNISVASSTDLLAGTDGVNDFRKWPLLDDTAKSQDVDDETVLYSYAQRYLGENRPPNASLSISVNGSKSPVVGTYKPGDWCSLIVNDKFFQMRLKSHKEPRDDVFVRKIQEIKVTVPDGTTFPETVSLTLIAEPEVDFIGQ